MTASTNLTIIRELKRVQAELQLRAIMAAMGVRVSNQTQPESEHG